MSTNSFGLKYMSEWCEIDDNCAYGHVKAGSCERTSQRIHEFTRNTEIAEFDDSFPRQDDIRWFDISMNRLFGMKVGKALQNLQRAKGVLNRERFFKIWLHTPSTNLPAIFSPTIAPRSLIRMPTASGLPPSQYSKRIFISLDEGDIYVPCHWTMLICFAEAMDSSPSGCLRPSSCFQGASKVVIAFRVMIMPVGLCLTLCTAPPRRRESSSNTSSENSRYFGVVGNPIRIASSPVTKSRRLSNVSVGRCAGITLGELFARLGGHLTIGKCVRHPKSTERPSHVL